MQSQKNTSGTTRSAADHVKRAASEGPPNTFKTGNEAAGALELATRLHALLSDLPKLGVTDKDGKIGGEPSDASLSLPPADKDAERDAVHCEKEHDNANVTATLEGSISPETPRSTPENDIEEATSRRNGDGPSASWLTALLSELQRLRCSPADQDSGDSGGPSCTCESTDSMPSPATSLSEHDADFVFPADLSDAIPATTGMVLIDEQSR